MRRSSGETKAVILAAARERFAADGYDRATIRAIAADAGIDPAMVMRYFGNKERLFAAAAEFDLELPDLSTVPRDLLGSTVVAHFLERWERDEALLILLRAGVTNEAVAERMRSIFAAQLAPVVARAVEDPRDVPLRAGLAASQILGMALCRFVLAFPPLVAMNRQEVVAWIGPTLQRYLTGTPDAAAAELLPPGPPARISFGD
ncbi:TetR/AcrR family transcriptional regulator [Nocardia cyriacigeorgica]|uniref:TetR/AcrR family transcriptional regulator n=1 Tax=Nocardia cyriacigeorgica TaxID=135487 RepID=A0A6P1DFJ5_9NOCA|nr:TetR family transcriptional regulator [Nocardia cyriacigeorgica]NEW47510.1 TetR/AcrR family transcriptional regulator [Nocardia cyriacigeorgica]